MTSLTPNDVRRWDTTAVLRVFQVANARAGTLQMFGEDLGQVGQLLAEWEGEAGAAFHSSLGKARADIEADGHESGEGRRGGQRFLGGRASLQDDAQRDR